MNFENSKTSKLHVLILKLTGKLHLKEVKKSCFIKLWYLLHMENIKKFI